MKRSDIIRWALLPVVFAASTFVALIIIGTIDSGGGSPVQQPDRPLMFSLKCAALSFLVIIPCAVVAPSRWEAVGALAAASYYILMVLAMRHEPFYGVYTAGAQAAIVTLVLWASLGFLKLLSTGTGETPHAVDEPPSQRGS